MPSSSDFLLSIDLGTQSVRAALVDGFGTIHLISKQEIEPYRSPQPGWAEQDPELFWSAVVAACQGLWKQKPRWRSRVAALSLSFQRNSVLFMDDHGSPLRPAIVWMDRRRADVKGWLSRLARPMLALAGMSDLLTHIISESEVNWMQQNEPEIWKRTDKMLYLSGYILHRLTGEYVDSLASIVGYIPFDYKRQQWCRPLDYHWLLVAVARRQLPDLVAPGSRLGRLLSEPSRQLGIPETTPLFAAGSDKACELLGSGCRHEAMAGISFGTTATVSLVSRRYHEVVRFFPSYPAAEPQAYHSESMVFRGFWLVRWFIEQFGGSDIPQAKKAGMRVEQWLDSVICKRPPGNLGMMLQPYWTPGVKKPGPEAKGVILGIGEAHDRYSLYQAIIEGILYALREGLEETERKHKGAVTLLRASGGGAQSRVILQMCADMTGKPVETVQTTETSLLGAAINSAVGLGWYPNHHQAVQGMSHVADHFTPDSGRNEIYSRLYRDIYKKVYRKIRPLHRRIQEATGYPER